MQEIIENKVDQNSCSEEMSEVELHRLEFIERFHGFIREIRWHGSEQFKPRLEDALGLTLSGATDEECMIFFNVLLESVTFAPMDTFFATFILQQSKTLQRKSDYHQRAQKIINHWNFPIRCSLNMMFLHDHKVQCIESIESIQEALEKTCIDHPSGIESIAIYNDSRLKKAISLAAVMCSHHSFGFNEFIDEIRQLDRDEKNGVVEFNQQVLFDKSFIESGLIKPLVLWANSIAASIIVTRESTATRYAVLKLQCAKLEQENTQLSGYKSVIDDMESVIIPRYKDEIRALKVRKANLIADIKRARDQLDAYQDELEILNFDVDYWIKDFNIVTQKMDDSHGEEADNSSEPNTPRFE